MLLRTFRLSPGADHVNYWVNDFPAIQVSDMLSLRVSEETVAPESVVMDYAKIAKVVQGLVQLVNGLEGSGNAQGEEPGQGFWASLFVKSANFFE